MNDEYSCLKLENQLCFPLYAVARKITGQYTPFLKPLGITYTQYIVFMVLWEKDKVSVGDLCTKLYLDSGTLTPLLKKMEDKGWIIRSRSKQDERVVHIQLTEEGMNLRDACKTIPAKVGACVPLTPEDAQKLYSILYQILGEMK